MPRHQHESVRLQPAIRANGRMTVKLRTSWIATLASTVAIFGPIASQVIPES